MISHCFVVPRYSFFTSNHSLPKSAFCRPAHSEDSKLCLCHKVVVVEGGGEKDPGPQTVCGNGEEEEEIIHFYVPEDHSVPLCQLSSLGLLVGLAASSCPETRDGGYRRRETFSPAMSTNFPEPHGVCHNMLRSI